MNEINDKEIIPSMNNNIPNMTSGNKSLQFKNISATYREIIVLYAGDLQNNEMLKSRKDWTIFSLISFLYFFVVHGETILVRKNGKVTLACNLSANKKFLWQGPPNTTTYALGLKISPKLSHKNRLAVKMIKKKHQVSFTIVQFKKTDEGQYKCVQYSYTSQKDVTFYTLRLQTDPTNMTIDGENADHIIYVNEGSPASIICKIRSGYPREILSWVAGKKTLNESDTGLVLYSTIPTKKDHLSNLTCRAVVSLTSFVLQKSVRLFLNFCPEVSIEKGPIITVTENAKLNINCKYKTNSPLQQIQWIDEAGKSISMNSAVLSFTRINRTQSGIYRCEVANKVGKGNDSVNVVVQYAPDISFKEYFSDAYIRIKCVPSGIPKNYTFFDWKHTTEYGNFLENLEGDGHGNIKLRKDTFASKWFLRRGLYICLVSNGIPKNNEIIIKDQHFFNESGIPYFVNTNDKIQFGTVWSNTTLSADFISFPHVNNITVITEKSIVPRGKVEIIDEVKVSEIVRNRKVFIKGSRVLIHQLMKPDVESQLYTIRLSNDLGDSAFTIELRPASAVKQSDPVRTYVIVPLVLFFLLMAASLVFVYFYQGGKVNINRLSCIRKESVQIEVGPNVIENEMYGWQNNNLANASNAQQNNVPVYSSIERREQLGPDRVVSYRTSEKRKPDPLNDHQKVAGDDRQNSASDDMAAAGGIPNREDSQLTYIEVCFDRPPSEYRNSFLRIDQKNPYAEIDFSRTADLLRERPVTKENDDNDFVDEEDVKKLRKKSYFS